MRALYWILGAFASLAGGALLLDHRSKRRLSDGFFDALRKEPFAVQAYEPSVAGGYRAEAFRGVVGGKPFAFAARTDADGAAWEYALIWGGARIDARWNPLSGEPEHPLQLAYLILRRRASKDDGLSN